MFETDFGLPRLRFKRTRPREFLSIDQETISRNGEAINQLTDAGIVFDSKIDMFLDTEAEGTGVGEVAHLEFVFLDLESLVEDLFGLGASDGAVARDLFVTSDTEGSDGVSGLKNFKKLIG